MSIATSICSVPTNLQCCRSFVLADLCDTVDAQNLGPSINSISGYMEGRLVILKNAKVSGTGQVSVWAMLLYAS